MSEVSVGDGARRQQQTSGAKTCAQRATMHSTVNRE
jgi:hypothetical protein